jgi:hypothetical protein
VLCEGAWCIGGERELLPPPPLDGMACVFLEDKFKKVSGCFLLATAPNCSCPSSSHKHKQHHVSNCNCRRCNHLGSMAEPCASRGRLRPSAPGVVVALQLQPRARVQAPQQPLARSLAPTGRVAAKRRV